MGRPKLTDIRRQEILDAFERCVARCGLEGSSLEQVAHEAGVQRSILRHYIGNRDDLIHAMADRVVAKYRTNLEEFLSGISETKRIRQLLSYFFPDSPMESAESVMVVEALIASGEKYPRVREQMLAYVDDLVGQVAGQLRLEFPKTTRHQCWQVAYGIVSICFNQESLSPLGLPGKYLKSARSCAKTLISSLEA